MSINDIDNYTGCALMGPLLMAWVGAIIGANWSRWDRFHRVVYIGSLAFLYSGVVRVILHAAGYLSENSR